MLIKWGSIVTQGRGKLGGHVYSKNRGGSYVRTNKVPTNPQTQYQQFGRSILTQLSQGWSNLSQENIDSWNAAVEQFKRTNVFGDQVRLSGKNLYVSLNKNLMQVGESVLPAPPSPAEIIVPTALSLAQPTASTFEITPTVASQVDFLQIHATAPLSAGTSYVRNQLHHVATEKNYTSGVIDIFDDYETRYGALTSGMRVGVGVFSVNASGQRSPIFSTTILIA